MNNKHVRMIVVGVLGFIFGIFCLTTILKGIRTVPAGYVGVKMRFGKVAELPLTPGLHFTIPYCETIVNVDTRLKSFEIEAGAASKDLQVVETKISVQHSLNGDSANKAYQKVGTLEQIDMSIVAPAVLESLKAVTAHYTAEELITKRDIVKQQVSEEIQRFIDQTLAERSIDGAIHVANVAIKDFDFSREFNASIEAKVRASQEALRAQNEKQKRITDAEALAKEKELSASAEAFKIEQESTARAAAIEREAKALAANPLLLQLRAIEKWDGSVPRFASANNIIPFMNVETLTGNQ